MRRVSDPGYAPDRAALADDYLAASPTRNRALDLMPLLAHIDGERVRAAVDDIPLLGICRGAQLLNIVRGGSLHQSLRSRRRHTGNRRTLLPCKTVQVVAGSTVEAVLGTGRLRVNSLHDQGIHRIGDGLRVVATDRDAIVQAIERPGARFVIGVQWHPEFLVYLPSQRRLFRSLVAAAAADEAVPFETVPRP